LYKIWIHDLTTGKRKRIFKKGYQIEQITDYSYPVMAWHPSGQYIAFFTEEKGNIKLYYYNIEEKELTVRNFMYFEKVLDFSFSEEGSSFVFSGYRDGQSDIYIHNIPSSTNRQITNDRANDHTPRYIDNSSGIIFASDRLSDNMNEDALTSRSRTSDLYIYSLDSDSDTPIRLTDEKYANQTSPVQAEAGEYIHLSDKSGIVNRYISKLDSTISQIDTTIHYRYFSISHPLTQYSRNIIEQDYNSLTGNITEIVYNRNRYYMYNATTSNGEIIMDGVVNEPAWENIEPLPMVMHRPVFNNPPSERTEVRIGYNEEFVYISGRLYDSNPASIMTTSMQRDEQSRGNDWFTVIFDTFNDKENALAFATTPIGLRRDFTISKDAMTSGNERPNNDSWNTFWEVATSLTDEGWFVEMEIPLSSLRFKEEDGRVIMGLIVQRYIPSKNETVIFPAIPPNWGPWSASRPSKAQEIILEGVQSKKPFYIAPYVSGGLQQDYLLNNGNTAYERNDDPRFNIGLDVKYGLTNNLTLDITVNTDFAQVEADNEQVNLTRFSLFFPEKRTFFQERSSIFSFNLGGRNDMFYSRTIGMYAGNQVPIYGGLRLTGMAGKWDIGILDMQTHEYESSNTFLSDLPSENLGVVRLRRNVINDNSYIGGIVTSRLGMDGSYNFAYGVDGIFKFMENDYLNIKLSQVSDDEIEFNGLSLDPVNIFANWSRFNEEGLGYDFTYSRSGKDYMPEMGFLTRSDYSLYSGNIMHGWIMGENSNLFSQQLTLNSEFYTSNETGKTESAEIGIGYDLQTKSGMFGRVELIQVREHLVDTFSLSDNAFVPDGRYISYQADLRINTPQSRRFSARLQFSAGEYYDGKRFSFTPNLTWNANAYLQLRMNYSYNRVKFDSRNQDYTAQIAGLNGQLMFSTKLIFNALVQYNSNDNRVTSNLRLRYNPKEGNDFYLVYNENRNTDIQMTVPELPGVNNRLILLKYTYTFVL